MTKKTHAILCLDRSGSMSSCREATIDGFNEQLDSLSRADGKVFATCLQFDQGYNRSEDIEVLYERIKVVDAPRLTTETYEPRGGTPMLDAVGRAIAIGDSDKKSDSIVVIILSDGMENASREETYASIADKIKSRTAKGNWTFVYIGANQDLSDVSKRMNIPMGNMMAYTSTPVGTRTAFAASANSTAMFAASASLGSSNYFGANPEEEEKEEATV